jgi:NADH dehydrogenase (ubiquinone) 1 alpha subcomplex subunit 2
VKHYTAIKQDNPTLPVLVRECEIAEPRIVARFGEFFADDSHRTDFGVEKSVSVPNLDEAQIAHKLRELSAQP